MKRAHWIFVAAMTAGALIGASLTSCFPHHAVAAEPNDGEPTEFCVRVWFVADTTPQAANLCFEYEKSCIKARDEMIAWGGVAHARVGECH